MTDTDFAIVSKLNRAMRYMHELDRTIRDYLKSDAHEVINDFQSDPGFLIVKVKTHRPPPPRCSLLIGDFLYNTRASLDYMACELARINGQPVDEHVEFPIFKNRDAFWHPKTGKYTPGAMRRLGMLHAVHQAVIEAEQPFTKWKGKEEEDPLWLLYVLSNYDRHQFIHLTTAQTNASFYDFTPRVGALQFKQVNVNYGPIDREAEVARFKILSGSENYVHVSSQVRFDVAFSKDGPCAGYQVLKTLAAIGVRVGEILHRLVHAEL
jgi:hypothetical protein